MTEEERNALRVQRDAMRRERDAEIAAVNSKYERKLQAYSIILDEEAKPNTADPFEVFKTVFGGAKPSQMENIIAAINNIRKYDGDEALFSTVTVADRMQKMLSDRTISHSSLSNPLWRLRKSGWIEIVKEGQRGAPALYKVTKQWKR